jgi:hypothetical protein
MDYMQNCDSYINIPWPQTYKSYLQSYLISLIVRVGRWSREQKFSRVFVVGEVNTEVCITIRSLKYRA